PPSLCLLKSLQHAFCAVWVSAESVNVASLHSVTRVLDAWGKRIFNEIKTLLHTEPSTLLPDYSRVRPLSESLNDLFREVALLRKRITELSQRLATLEPLWVLDCWFEQMKQLQDVVLDFLKLMNFFCRKFKQSLKGQSHYLLVKVIISDN
uniref:Dynein heavy chain tail domain-containing protein n=1 Tax=Mola mola TaxID=94237 RepID=A0A3Q3WF65_MOLML